MDLSFYKLRVCDADLILVDDFAGAGRDRDWSAAARFLLDRRRGAGADRLAVLAKAEASVWLRVFGSRGEPDPCPFDAAICAARFLLDSGRSASETVKLRLPGAEIAVDVLDAASLGLRLGQPRGLPDGALLDLEAAAGRKSLVQAGGERYEVLPLGLAGLQGPGLRPDAPSATARGPEALALFYEGGTKSARARIRSAGRDETAPPVLPIRLVSREELWVKAAHSPALDSCATASLALAAAAAAGYAGEEALVRLRGGALWVEWAEEIGLYAAARPEYVYKGEFHLDD
jgi:diaminopimelate epimerase